MYIDALHDKKTEQVHFVTRVNGQRCLETHTVDHHFYIEDPRGTYKSLYGKPLKKLNPSTSTEKRKLINQYTGRKWESDVNPIMRLIEQKYKNSDTPKMNVAFFDIETAFDLVTGYSDPADALNMITSIAVYLQWCDLVVCLAVPPDTLTVAEAQAIADEVGDTIIFDREEDMLDAFINLVDDADVLSGWNSEAYDIPYTINRIIRKLGKTETRRLSPFNEQPTRRSFERGGQEKYTYEFPGKLHLDYMQLYRKYTYEEKHSYALNSIAEIELGETKVEYSGTLHQLYNNDFKKFLEYNIQDTMLLDKLDKKLQYIDLCNTIAHANHVLIQTTMGSVAMIDQAIMVESHEQGVIAPDNNRGEVDARAAGGWVAKPKKGLHKWVGSADLTSLYPSVIRAFNMSPETIIAQLDLSGTYKSIDKWINAAAPNTYGNWWNDKFHPDEMSKFLAKDDIDKLNLKFENGDHFSVTGKELHDLIFNSGQNWCISANGTIFNQATQGIIPRLLTRWFKERKMLQGFKKNYSLIEDNAKEKGIVLPDHLIPLITVRDVPKDNPYVQEMTYSPAKIKDLIEADNADELSIYLSRKNIVVVNGKLLYADQTELKSIVSFWDKRQLVKKINLNSLYGAILNAGSRFFDQRVGQSVTLSGRNITKHMAAKTNEFVTGIYDHYGESCIYGDTDSVYFSAYPILKKEIEEGRIEWTKESVTDLYDRISAEVSDTFPEFLNKTFNVPLTSSTKVIQSDREIVALSALFIKKKRYAALVYDAEGKREDVNGKPGKIKAMGLDLRRSDTPKFVQKFLMDILVATLTDLGETNVIGMIREFKEQFNQMKPWEKGTPKAVNNLTSYKERQEVYLRNKMMGMTVDSLTVPGHVRAALNWNALREIHKDNQATKILDGQKIVVCKLKDANDCPYTSVAFPSDEKRLPEWFLELPFDDDIMEEAIVDQKVENLLGVLNWDLSQASKQAAHFNSLFD